ncbi:MAG: DNA topoisomerase VI subunit B, partial [bacterium]|nr:DNA topoisomerase VI subunit B [bacterium]
MSKPGSVAFAGAKGGKKPAGTARKAATKKAAKPAAKKAGRKKAAKPAAKKAGRKKAVKPTATKAGRKKAATPRTRTTANEMASKQRDISVSEFFAKNRHLLGFDNPSKALLTTVKEGVDNALDACEEAGIAPDIRVEIHQKDETRFRIAIEDNGPGIVKSQVPKIFGRLLYGSKFHRLRQSRGQQGIGISAAGMYGLLTTGRPIVITTRTGAKKPAHHFELVIDTKSNEPRVKKDLEVDWQSDHGTRVEIELEGAYRGGRHSVEASIRQISLANPHARPEVLPPNPEKTNGSVLFDRVTEELPPETDEIKPHPYGVELGVLMQMFRDTKSRNVRGCLQADFSRVSGRIADEICTRAKVPGKRRPSEVTRDEAERVHKSIQATKIMSPPTDCIAPIGEDLLESALRQEVEADFYASVTRKPTVYRGNPFMIEVGLAYGGKLSGDDPVTAFRFANRVPLQYQQGACAITKAITGTDWKAYRMQQPRGAMPVGPMLLMVHIASVWVPFTSESKEAVAQYPEILKELRLGLQECGRRVATHIRKQRREADEEKKRAYIVKYIPQVAVGLQQILDLSDRERDKIVANLSDVLERSRKM